MKGEAFGIIIRYVAWVSCVTSCYEVLLFMDVSFDDTDLYIKKNEAIKCILSRIFGLNYNVIVGVT